MPISKAGNIGAPRNNLADETTETNFSHNDLHYASISFSKNLSSLNRKESKLVEEQRECIGPLGDIYSVAKK